MEYFNNIKKINYEGPTSGNPFSFKHFNPEEIIMGKKMKEHLPFAVAYWHTFKQNGSDPFGAPSMSRPWDNTNPMELAKNRLNAAFDFFEKLGVEYFCFHDADLIPEADTLSEFFNNIDEITDLMLEKMNKTGVKLLWNTADMFTNRRYMHGAASSCEADVFAFAAAQVKKGIDISKKLGGKNYVFWGGREGYEDLINTDMDLEENNIARLFKMAIEYSEKISHEVQFLIEPKPKEPSKHQYDFDAATTLAFLRKYNLLGKFKLNLEANHATLAGHTFEHELYVARNNDALGSIDANQGDLLLGWDTDEFPTDVKDATLTMYQILKNGGLSPGGINFDAKVRRTSFELEDLFLSHIAGMDTFAKGLKNAANIIENGFLDENTKNRYKSYESGIGKKIIDNKTSLEELYEYALTQKEPDLTSSKIDYLRAKRNEFIK